MPEQAIYSHGHHASVVKSHARRTAQNSMAFLLPHIKPHHKILDVGCGPGSITIDLAHLVPKGSVTGVDASEDILDQARALAHARSANTTATIENLTFQRADANDLPFADGSFDVVFCHQLLHHVADPVGVLREMRRVARKGTRNTNTNNNNNEKEEEGGIVAAREADWRVFAWYPDQDHDDDDNNNENNKDISLLTKWRDVQVEIVRAAGGQPSAGRYLRAWAARAGFSVDEDNNNNSNNNNNNNDDNNNDVEFSWAASTWHGQEAVEWAETWEERTLRSSYAAAALRLGLATRDELDGIAAAWREWKGREHALMIAPNGQILCRVR